MKIVVIGGSGLIGSKLVARLEASGHEVVAASPSSGVDALTGEGLAGVLEGAAVAVDVSNSPSFEDDTVLAFFTTSTGNLLAAEATAGVGHHVALSVVGTERWPESGYFRAKLAQERLIEAGPVPYSLVHATQFFEFVASIAGSATEGDTVRLPPAPVQPIAGNDVADALAAVVVGTPVNGRMEIGGPERFPLDGFVRVGLRASGDPRTVVTDPAAPYFGAHPGEETLVPTAGAQLGATRFEDWLSRRAVAG